MRSISRKAAAGLIAVAMAPMPAFAATISGADYATQYDWAEFYAAAYNKTFRVEIAGNAFPQLKPEETARLLLPVMQANKPRVPLTFTYEAPAEPQHPDYRVVLIFNPANDLGADPVCRGDARRLREGRPGAIYVFAVYCRNDQAMSQAVGRTSATSPDDPSMAELFKDLFRTVFDDGYMRQRKGRRLNP